MRRASALGALPALALAACGDDNLPVAPPADAYVPLDAPNHPGAGNGGGILDTLDFAVVGDTRPVNIDDTANYPTDIIHQIWMDVEAESPHPQFAITTGDYMFASTTGSEQGPQLDAYLGARAAYSGIVYATMGNHECTGYTASNCGPGGSDGEPPNYMLYLSRMANPLGEPFPWFAERFAAKDGSWTAKFVFVAANAWNPLQAQWLADVMTEPTTYTFVVRHEPSLSDTAPGVSPSDQIIIQHPFTMLITGHTHTYQHIPAYRTIVVGNGGAPLTSATDYGYVILARGDDGNITVTAYDYMTHATMDQFVVTPGGVAPQQ